MTQQIINIGAAPNDGTGDTARAGGQKINDNFTELYGLPAAQLSFTATRLLIGDGTSPITTDAGLTFTGGTLYTSGISSKPSGKGLGTELFGLNAYDSSTQNPAYNTYIGYNAGGSTNNGYETNNTGIGANVNCRGQQTTLIGGGASSLSFLLNSVGIGYNASVRGSFQVIIGAGISTTGTTNQTTVVGSNNLFNPSGGATPSIGIFGAANSYDHKKGGIFGKGVSSLRDNELGIGFADFEAAQPFSLTFTGTSDSFISRQLMRIFADWQTSADATRKARTTFYVNDTAEREYLKATSNGTGADVAFNGASYTFAVPVNFAGYTVATLPAGTVGMRAYVTDALAPTFLTALVGGGAVTCPAFYNGAAWVAG